MSIHFARPFARSGALRLLALTGSAAIALTGLSVQAQPRGGETLETTPVPSTPIAGDFSLAAVGDVIYLRPMLATLEKQAPDMLRILRGADVTFGNFETTALDLATFKGSPQAESGGTWMLADPGVPKEVAAMGIDIVGHANNHATDWGVEGMIETLKLLDAAHLVRAGTGRTMPKRARPLIMTDRRGASRWSRRRRPSRP
jgi:poly-gamma-glutamate synthesis protein (capsule biosynthesis protein)